MSSVRWTGEGSLFDLGDCRHRTHQWVMYESVGSHTFVEGGRFQEKGQSKKVHYVPILKRVLLPLLALKTKNFCINC